MGIAAAATAMGNRAISDDDPLAVAVVLDVISDPSVYPPITGRDAQHLHEALSVAS